MTLPLTQLQTNLATAQAQYHKLVTGQLARVFVDQNGERVEFTAANKNDLYNYIQQLMGDICPGVAPVIRGPIRFVF